jgi:hypothetical protein
LTNDEAGGCKEILGFSVENVRFLKPGDRSRHNSTIARKTAVLRQVRVACFYGLSSPNFHWKVLFGFYLG